MTSTNAQDVLDSFDDAQALLEAQERLGVCMKKVSAEQMTMSDDE